MHQSTDFMSDPGVPCRRKDKDGNPVYDPDTWFPELGQAKKTAKAQTLCRSCPSREACAEYAVNFPVVLTGVWGGLSRREIRRERIKRGLTVEHESVFSHLPSVDAAT